MRGNYVSFKPSSYEIREAVQSKRITFIRCGSFSAKRTGITAAIYSKR
jgi:hypothetical protein